MRISSIVPWALSLAVIVGAFTINKVHRDLDRRELKLAHLEQAAQEKDRDLLAREKAIQELAVENTTKVTQAAEDLKAAEAALAAATKAKTASDKNLATISQANHQVKRSGLVAQQAAAKQRNAESKLYELNAKYKRQEATLSHLRIKLAATEADLERMEDRALRAEERANRPRFTTYVPRRPYFNHHRKHRGQQTTRDERHPTGTPVQ